MITLNETHDPGLESWVQDANRGDHPFPIQNLPFGVFATVEDPGRPRVGVAIGDHVADVCALREAGLLPGCAQVAASHCSGSDLGRLMAADPEEISALRLALSRLFRRDAAERAAAATCLRPRSAVSMRMPARIGNFTDFYTSIHHAMNAGQLMRPGGSLAQNFRHLPIAYHGRGSSVTVSGASVKRPRGQIKRDDAADPVYAASARLDFEAEVGFIVGRGNPLGETIELSRSPSHVFGLCLVNDWSARDIQSWEAQPLGPFLGKSFMTTISPWIVTLEALAPFRRPAADRGADAPPLQPYLNDPADRAFGGLGIHLTVTLRTAGGDGQAAVDRRIAELDFSTQYWTIFQMLTHHASNGCNLMTGDLLASGTVSSGSGPGMAGCLLELSRNGKEPIAITGTQRRAFLEDGDEVVIEARCSRPGARTIGFGECSGRVIPAD